MEAKTFSLRNLPCKAHVSIWRKDHIGVTMENKDGLSDYPIPIPVSESDLNRPMGNAVFFRYDGKLCKLVWDYPEKFPRYARKLAIKAWQYIDEQNRTATLAEENKFSREQWRQAWNENRVD